MPKEKDRFVSDSVQEHLKLMIEKKSMASAFRLNYQIISASGVADVKLVMFLVFDRGIIKDIEEVLQRRMEERDDRS